MAIGRALDRELEASFGTAGPRWREAARRFRAWRSRASWGLALGVREGAKRGIDVLASAAALALLAPLFAVVALLIRRHDGGPALFWQTRVGRWGREFRCPKFRSMVLDAEARKAALLASNDHGSSVTFKMKRDPRITPIGRGGSYAS